MADDPLQSLGPTLPIDAAADILRQPVQPPIDAASANDAYDKASFDKHLPDFFQAINNSIAQAQAERQAQTAQYAQQAMAQAQAKQAQDAAEAEAAAQAEQAANASDSSSDDASTSALAALAPYDTASGSSGSDTVVPSSPVTPPDVNGVPYYLVRPDETVQGALAQQPDLGALQRAASESQTPAEMTAHTGIAEDTTPAIPESAVPTIMAENARESAAPQEQGGFRGFLHGFNQGVGDVLNPISEAGGKIGEEIAKGGLIGQGLEKAGVPEQIANPLSNLPGSQETHEDIGKKVGEFAAPAVADILTGGALTPAFGVQAAGQAAEIGVAYNDGDMSGKQALLNLAMLSPQLIPIVLHGAGKLSEFAREHPEAVADIQAKFHDTVMNVGEQGRMKLRDETGALKLGPDGKPTGVQAEDAASRININEEPQTPMAETQGAHRLTTPDGDRLDYRMTPEGAHISDVTVQVEREGRGTALVQRALDDIRARNPEAIITADLNSEGGARLMARVPGAEFSDFHGNPIEPNAAIEAAARGEGPQVSIRKIPEYTQDNPLKVTRPQAAEGAAQTIDEFNQAHPNGRVGNTDVQLKPSDLPGNEDAVLLDWIGTREHAQGQGHGSAALDAVLDIADRNHTPVVLQADARGGNLDQAALEDFYARHGFETTPRDETVMRYEPGTPRTASTPEERAGHQLDARIRQLDDEIEQRSQEDENDPDIPEMEKELQDLRSEQAKATTQPKAAAPAPLAEVTPEQVAESQRAQAGTVYTPPETPEVQTPEEKPLTADTGEQATLPGLEPVQPEPDRGYMGQTVSRSDGKSGTVIRESPKGLTVQYGDGTTEVIDPKKLQAPNTPPPNVKVRTRNGGEASGPQMTPDVRRLKGYQQLNRVVQRFFGGEYDKKPVVAAKKEVGRQFLAESTDATESGKTLQKMADRVSIPTLKDDVPDHVRVAIERLGAENKDQTILQAAYQYPDYFNVAPDTQRLFARTDATLGRADKWNTQAGFKLDSQTDPKFFPRVVVDKDGAPLLSNSRPTRERTTGDFWDFLNDNNGALDNYGLSIQHYLEQMASARVGNRFIQAFKKLKNFDGKGDAYRSAVPGSAQAEGYTIVPGFSDVHGKNVHSGKSDMVRQDLYESAMAPFSKGLTSGQLVLTQPARVIRAINFALGPFHAIFENAALGLDNAKLLPKTMAQEFRGMIDPAYRTKLVAAEAPNTMLMQMHGLQGGDYGGTRATTEVSRVRGIPETEGVLDKIPVVGDAAKWNRDVTFNWVVPWVQQKMAMGRLTDWMARHPDLVPKNFDDVMSRADPAEMKAMSESNPAFRAAAEDAAAHANHVTGFTENTLTKGERQFQGGVLSVPTITRAIAANTRDLFRGGMRGTYARDYWRNAATTIGGIAIGGSLLAGGEKYTDPSNWKDNVLNPDSSNFMYIVTKDGTRINLIPSPIRSPIKTMLAGAGAGATAALAGDDPLDVVRKAVEGQGDAFRQFAENRLSAPFSAADVGMQTFGKGEGTVQAVKDAVTGSLGRDVPVALEPLAHAALKGEAPDRGDFERVGYSSIGASEYGPSAYKKYDDYLKSKGFPDGAQTSETKTNKFQSFIQNDPQAVALKTVYDTGREENATGAKKQSIAIQKDRQSRITAAQDAFNQSQGTDKYIQFRKAVGDIRANEAQRQADLNYSPSKGASSTADKATLDSWRQTYTDATDPITKVLDPNELDSLQAAWEKEHPGEYKRLIQPTYEAGGLSAAEKLLRRDRDYINSTGYWKLDQQAWNYVKDGVPELSRYKNYQEYEHTARIAAVQHAKEYGYQGDNASAAADYLYTKDKIAAMFQKVRSIARNELEIKNPKLVPVLDKWGYSSTSKLEASLLPTGAAPTDTDTTGQYGSPINSLEQP